MWLMHVLTVLTATQVYRTGVLGVKRTKGNTKDPKLQIRCSGRLASNDLATFTFPRWCYARTTGTCAG